MLSRNRFWVAVMLCAAIASYRVIQTAPTSYEIEAMANSPDPFMDVGSLSVRLFGAFSQDTVTTFTVLLPFIVGLTGAGALASDRNRHYEVLVLVRGVSKIRYLMAKAATMSLCAGLATLFSIALVFCVTAIVYPWGATTINDPSFSMSPFPDLFRYAPFLNDLVFTGLLCIGAASLALSGLVAGALTKNEYIATGTPFAVVFIGAFVLRDELVFLSPQTYLAIREDYPYNIPSVWLPYAAPLYWLAFAALCFVASALVFLRRELD